LSQPQLQIRQLTIELHLHPHATERFDEVWLIGLNEAGIARLKDHFGGGVEQLTAQTAIKHPDNASHTGPGASSRRSPAGSVFPSNTEVRL